MNQQMDLLDNLLTTHPIQISWESSIQPYLKRQFWCVDDPDHPFLNGSVLTWTPTSSDDPEQLLTLHSIRLLLVISMTAKSIHWMVPPSIISDSAAEAVKFHSSDVLYCSHLVYWISTTQLD